MQGLHTGGDHDLAGIEAAGDGDDGRIVAQHVDVAHRHRAARRIHDPDGGLPIEFRQRRRRDLDGGLGVLHHMPGDGRAEPHGRRGIRQADLDLEGAGHGVRLGRDLAHAPTRDHRWVVRQVYGDRRIAGRRAKQLRRHVENRVAALLAGKLEDHLPGLNDLALTGAQCRQEAGRIRLQLGEAHEIVRGLHLRLGGIDLRLGGLQRLRR
jgi:hypothetical protein